MKCVPGFRWLSRLVFGVVFAFLACHLTQDDKVEQRMSFNKLYDALAQYDSVQITLKDTSGHTIDNVYHGKIDTISEIMNLPAPHWDGGLVLVVILGYKDGELVYHMDRKFDGNTDKSIDTTYVILPNTTLAADNQDIQIMEGDSIPFPHIAVLPMDIKDKSLTWISSQPTALSVTPGGFYALKRGSVLITAKLNSNPNKSLTLQVTVVPNPAIPDSLFIDPDSLSLAAGGAAAEALIKIKPNSADGAVIWAILDTSIAHFTSDGTIQGLKKGETRLIAKSAKKASLVDTIRIAVSGPVAVEGVQFQKDSIDLFLGGASESLWIDVTPPKANPKVDFQVLNSSLVTIVSGKLLAIATGSTQVVARSSENPNKSDTLKINIFASQNIEAVKVMPDSLKLYTGGEAPVLIGSVYPSTAFQGIQWRSQNPTVATVDGNGKVSAVGAGNTYITALSRVDSTKQATTRVSILRDVPKVSVGRDTTISLGSSLSFRPSVTQEYGKVAEFKWDLNGDGVWDGVSDSIQSVSFIYSEAKEFIASFYVKDTEGNDTTVIKKIKTVQGLSIVILSPKDSSYTKEFLIDVSWAVNNKVQDSLVKQVLKVGSNTITRSVKDETGRAIATSITVFVDTIPPDKPLVHGATQTSSVTPVWSWGRGAGGAGIFKAHLDAEDFSSSPEIKDTIFVPGTDLSEGTHTLFVQERDAAGNWSQSGRFTIRVDLTAPNVPQSKPGVSSQSNSTRPTWFWLSGGGGNNNFRVKIDDADMSKGTTSISDAQFSSPNALNEGLHTLYVQEEDSVGNWSKTGTIVISVDLTPPEAPIFTQPNRSPLNSLKPLWKWTSGGGGIGKYRYKLDGPDLTLGANILNTEQFTPSIDLSQGKHTLYVQEQDSAGNWSVTSTKSVVVALRESVGSPGLTAGGAYFSSLKITPSGQLYVAFQDDSKSGKASVQQYSGTNWQYVGNGGFSAGSSAYTSLDISKTGVPFVGFQDYGIANKISVMRFNGTSWVAVGASGFSPGAANYFSLALDAESEPFVIFSDETQLNRAVVMKFNGATWESLSVIPLSEGYASSSVIRIDKSGHPIIAFVDAGRNKQVVVKKYSGTFWTELTGLSSTEGASDLSLALDKSDKPAIAYSDSSVGGKLSVKRYNGSNWDNVGPSGISIGTVGGPSLEFNSLNQPVISYEDGGVGDKAQILQFNGNFWEAFNSGSLSDGYVGFVSLAIDSLDVPYTSFTDASRANKITVMKTSFDP